LVTCTATVALAVPVAAASFVAGVEVAGDHDADRLDPTRHVEHRVEAALDEDVFVLGGPLPPRRLLTSLLDTEELEALVIVVVTAGDRCEVVAAAA
jgi:hypothetical protein